MTRADGGVATVVPTVADWASPSLRTSCAGTSGCPVAVNVKGLPLRPAAVAIIVFLPATTPSFQLPTAASPFTLVEGVPPVSDPPPESTANVTVTPATPLPNLSVTRAVGGVATFVLTVAALPNPVETLRNLPPPAVAVAVNVTGEPVSPPTDAVAVWMPAVSPSVRVAVAMPFTSVSDVAGVIEPPPDATAHATVTPCTGLFDPSFTIT